MARRRHKIVDTNNNDRWLISYADFVTLLFAFFVVMYAISSINEGKYRVLSDSIVSAFDKPQGPVVVKSALQSQPYTIGSMDTLKTPITPVQYIERSPKLERLHELADTKIMTEIAYDVTKAVQPLIDEELISIKKDDLWVEITINSNILFSSGQAKLQPNAIPVLSELAKVLKDIPNDIQVEGYTDNVPIKTEVFPSNWELSASRAANVVHLFMNEGVDPKRMAAIGFGEYRPIGDNKTIDGRKENRRVEIIILADSSTRRVMGITEQK